MKTIYICRMGENWNSEYLAAFETLGGVAKEIFDRASDEDLFPIDWTEKDLAANMKYRFDNGYIELFMPDEADSELESFQMMTEFSVQAVKLEK